MDDRRMVLAFKWGFLSDRVVEILTYYKQNGDLNPDDEMILNSASELLHKIIEGYEQADSGEYYMNALESLKLYNRTLDIINTENFITTLSEYSDPKLKKFILYMDEIIQNVKEKKSKVDLEHILLFFNLLRDLTLDESHGILEGVYDNRGIRRWGLMPENTFSIDS
jgi:hypothetical protein